MSGNILWRIIDPKDIFAFEINRYLTFLTIVRMGCGLEFLDGLQLERRKSSKELESAIETLELKPSF